MRRSRLIEAMGARGLGICDEVGGMTLLLAAIVRGVLPPRFDRYEFVRHLHAMANRSLPIIALTAFFTGGIMVVQAGIYVRQFAATALVGWGTGYAVLREVGPILIALMFSGRVGARNTAELGTMTVTEQVDGLRALDIDPVQYLVIPRTLAMVIALVGLTILGVAIALGGAALFSWSLLDIGFSTFWVSFSDNLLPTDFLHGLAKSAVFGLSIAICSCYFGLSVRGGSIGVGKAVNAHVVTAAVAIMFLDFFLTYVAS